MIHFDELTQIVVAVIGGNIIHLAGKGDYVDLQNVLQVLQTHCPGVVIEKTDEGYTLTRRPDAIQSVSCEGKSAADAGKNTS